MTQLEYETIRNLLLRNPPLFSIFGGIFLVLSGGLINIEILVSSGWSALITGVFLQIGWTLMLNSSKKRS